MGVHAGLVVQGRGGGGVIHIHVRLQEGLLLWLYQGFFLILVWSSWMSMTTSSAAIRRRSGEVGVARQMSGQHR